MPVPSSIEELSIAPADNYPKGSENVFPQADDYFRFYAACIAQLRDELKASGLPLCGTRWWGGSRSAIVLPMKAVDGDLLNRADYPVMWSFVAAGGWPIVTEAEWQADKLKRGSFSSGDGVTTFRMPDLNGKQPGSIGAVYLRGDGAGSAGVAGLLQDSQNLEHLHTASTDQTGAHTHQVSGTTSSNGEHSHAIPGQVLGGNGTPTTGPDGSRGDWYRSGSTTSASGSHSHNISGSAASAGSHSHSVTVNNSGGTEARGKAATGCHVMRVR